MFRQQGKEMPIGDDRFTTSADSKAKYLKSPTRSLIEHRFTKSAPDDAKQPAVWPLLRADFFALIEACEKAAGKRRRRRPRDSDAITTSKSRTVQRIGNRAS